VNGIGKAAIPPDLWFRASIVLIDRQPDPDRRAELRESFEYRAALSQYDGGLSRTEAERLAFRELRRSLGLVQ